MTLLITFLTGLFFPVGALISKAAGNQEQVKHISLAAGFGALLMVAAADLLPELADMFRGEGPLVPLVFTALGFGLLKLIDLFVPDHHEHSHDDREMIHIGLMSSFAIILHNMIEGMTVYGIGLNSFGDGASLALGIGMHNIPMGMLIYTTLKGEKGLRKTVILAVTTLSTLAGGLVMSLISAYMNGRLMGILIALTIGMIAFLLVFELGVYLLRQKKPLTTLLWMAAGMAVVVLAGLI